jgi:hypothetical protein
MNLSGKDAEREIYALVKLANRIKSKEAIRIVDMLHNAWIKTGVANNEYVDLDNLLDLTITASLTADNNKTQ